MLISDLFDIEVKVLRRINFEGSNNLLLLIAEPNGIIFPRGGLAK